MATGYIDFPISGASVPDNSTSNAPAGIVLAKTSASAPTPHLYKALFDATTKEHLYWQKRMPGNYASAPVLKVQYAMASATANGVVFDARIGAISDGDATDVDAKALSTTNTGTATVPATAGYIDEISITMTNADSLAAGDLIFLMLSRDPAHASDTATGDAEVLTVTLEYTTT